MPENENTERDLQSPDPAPSEDSSSGDGDENVPRKTKLEDLKRIASKVYKSFVSRLDSQEAQRIDDLKKSKVDLAHLKSRYDAMEAGKSGLEERNSLLEKKPEDLSGRMAEEARMKASLVNRLNASQAEVGILKETVAGLEAMKSKWESGDRPGPAKNRSGTPPEKSKKSASGKSAGKKAAPKKKSSKKKSPKKKAASKKAPAKKKATRPKPPRSRGRKKSKSG
jgi:hypothetical protein